MRPEEPPEPATIIVLDRVDDLAPVVLHDITYTCLVTDLLEHDPCTPFRYTYNTRGESVEKDVLLDESDPVWRMLRFEEMGVVIETGERGAPAPHSTRSHGCVHSTTTLAPHPTPHAQWTTACGKATCAPTRGWR